MSTGGNDKEWQIGFSIDDAKANAANDRQIEMLKKVEAAAKAVNQGIENFGRIVQERMEADAKRHEEAQTAIKKREAEKRGEIAKREADRAAAENKRAADRAVALARQQTDEQIREAERANQHAGGFAKDLIGTFGGFTTAIGAVGAAFAVVKTGLEDFEEHRKKLEELGAAALKYRDRLRDLSALAGGGTVTNADVLKFGQFQMQTGLGLEQAKGFSGAFESAVATATDANMSKDERSKLASRAALLAARVNPSGDTANIAGVGGLAGTLARFQRGGTAEGTVAQLDSITKIASLGEGTNAEQFAQLSKVLTTLVTPEGKGLAKDPREAAALVAMMSSTRPVGEAATGVNQLGRALRGFQNKTVLPGATMSQADFLKKSGVNEKDTLFQSLDKLMPALSQAEASGRALDAFLKEMGFSSEEEIQAIIAAYRATKQGTTGIIRAEAGKALDIKGSNAKEKQFTGSKTFRSATAEAGVEVGRVMAGQSVEEVNIAKKKAEGELEAEGELHVPGDWMTRRFKSQEEIETKRIRERAVRNLIRSGGLGKDVQNYAAGDKGLEEIKFRQFSAMSDTDLNDAIEQAKIAKAAGYETNAASEQRKTNDLLKSAMGGPITAPKIGAGRNARNP